MASSSETELHVISKKMRLSESLDFLKKAEILDLEEEQVEAVLCLKYGATKVAELTRMICERASLDLQIDREQRLETQISTFHSLEITYSSVEEVQFICRSLSPKIVSAQESITPQMPTGEIIDLQDIECVNDRLTDSVDALREQEVMFLEHSLNDFRQEGEYCYGFLNTNYDKVIEKFLTISSSCFVRKENHTKENGNKRFSQSAVPIFEHKSGNVPIGRFGKPFTIISTETRHCKHGPTEDGKGGYKSTEAKKPRAKRHSTKLGCLAVIQIRCVRVFDEFELPKSNLSNTNNSICQAKKKILENLKKDSLADGKVQKTSLRYYVKLALSTAHSSHRVGELAPVMQSVDKRIINQIHELVKKNITKLSDVKNCIEDFVEKELLSDTENHLRPRRTNRKYYPTKKDFENHIGRAISAQKCCKENQECSNTVTCTSNECAIAVSDVSNTSVVNSQDCVIPDDVICSDTSVVYILECGTVDNVT